MWYGDPGSRHFTCIQHASTTASSSAQFLTQCLLNSQTNRPYGSLLRSGLQSPHNQCRTGGRTGGQQVLRLSGSFWVEKLLRCVERTRFTSHSHLWCRQTRCQLSPSSTWEWSQQPRRRSNSHIQIPADTPIRPAAVGRQKRSRRKEVEQRQVNSETTGRRCQT